MFFNQDFHSRIIISLDSNKITNEFSEYLFSNEVNREETLQQLSLTDESKKGKVHVGFACWYNFDVIAAMRSNYAFIADIDPKMHNLYRIFANTIINSDDRKSFIDDLKNNLKNKDPNILQTYTDLDQKLADMLNNPYGWLNNEESFQFIKTLHLEGKIFYLNLSSYDEKTIADLSKSSSIP